MYLKSSGPEHKIKSTALSQLLIIKERIEEYKREGEKYMVIGDFNGDIKG